MTLTPVKFSLKVHNIYIKATVKDIHFKIQLIAHLVVFNLIKILMWLNEISEYDINL